MFRHNRLRALAVASLTIILVTLFSSLPRVSAGNLECFDVSKDVDLLRMASNDNVFLMVSDEDTAHVSNKICERLRQYDAMKKISPNGSNTVFVKLGVTDATTRMFSDTLNIDHFPSFLFISAGIEDLSKNSDHITSFKHDSESALNDFMRDNIGFSPLGGDVFTIIFFDSIASRFVSYGNTSGLDRLKQKGLALLVKFATLIGYKEPFKRIGKLYNRAFAMSLEHGMEYSTRHVARMEKTLQSGNLSPGEHHEVLQKIAILKSFSQPKTLTAEDNKKIYTHVALHIGLIFAALVLICLPAEEKVVNDVPVIAKFVDEK